MSDDKKKKPAEDTMAGLSPLEQQVVKAHVEKMSIFGFEENGTMIIIIPAGVMTDAESLGCMELAKDSLKGRLARKAKIRQKIAQPGMAAGLKKSLGGIFH